MDLSGLKRDAAAVSSGQWVSDIPGMDDLRLHVRGLSSPTVAAIRARKERKVPRDQREADGTIKTAVSIALFGEVLHEAVLLGWENLRDGDKQVAYDGDFAKQLCTDPDYGPFADAVAWAASVVDRGNSAMKEDAEKNSPAPSSGNFATGKKHDG